VPGFSTEEGLAAVLAGTGSSLESLHLAIDARSAASAGTLNSNGWRRDGEAAQSQAQMRQLQAGLGRVRAEAADVNERAVELPFPWSSGSLGTGAAARPQ